MVNWSLFNLPVVIYIDIMPVTWQKQKVKDTRIDLEKFNRCLSISHLRNPPSFTCYQRQNIRILSLFASPVNSRPHIWNGHTIDIKRLIFWKCDLITFVQIWFEPSISRVSFFRAVYKQKGQIWRILNWNYCTPHFWNGRVTYIKMLKIWKNDFIIFVQIWF